MIKTEKYNYSGPDRDFQGVLAYDNKVQGKRPVVLIAHTWTGQGKFEEEKAIALAKMGYLALAIDVYGKGKRAKDNAQAEVLMNEALKDRQRLLDRLLLALESIKGHGLAEPDKVAIIGFCFGGKCALDLARSAVDIQAAVCFHGIFDPPGLEQEEDIKAKILVLHGWEDPFAFPKDIVALGYELTERNALWEMDIYGHTGHAFTNPNANAPDQGMVYNPLASDRAWQRMAQFFEEVFGRAIPSSPL